MRKSLNKKLKLSIIIPAYNEEIHIAECLDAIAAQTVRPDEVLLVDNNCTDKTVEIASEHSFVKIIQEPKQGLIAARNAGFNAAKGDILGRIDADTVLDKNWVKVVRDRFEGGKIDGLAGLGFTPALPFLQQPSWSFYFRSYIWSVHGFYGTQIMWGGNMAISKRSWAKIGKHTMSDSAGIHEDQDISILMAHRGFRVVHDYLARSFSPNQSFRYLPKFIAYTEMRRKTRGLRLKSGHLPPPNDLRFSWLQRIAFLTLSIPASLVALVFGVLAFPIDFVAYRILGRSNWFD